MTDTNQNNVKPLSSGNAQYGSQMGRGSTPGAQEVDGSAIDKVIARPIMPDPYKYAYDAGGAYWGVGLQVWQVNVHTDEKHYVYYQRFGMTAEKQLNEKYPNTNVDVWGDTHGYGYEQAEKAINERRPLL